MIFNLSFFVVHVAMAASSLDVDIPLSERNLETTCVNNVKGAVNFWHTNKTSAENIYGNIEEWCTKDATSFSMAFYNNNGGGEFNENISSWDTSSSTNFGQVFMLAQSFNRDLTLWDTSNSVSFYHAFSYAASFNRDLSSWDISSAVNFNYMFYTAKTFGQCLRWDLSTPGITMIQMFDFSNGASAGDKCPAPDTSPPTSNVVAGNTGLRYNVTFKSMQFSNLNGQFQLALDYDIGTDASGLTVSLFETGCETPYSSPIVTVKNTTGVDKKLIIDKRLFSVANTKLITHEDGKGLSKGSLDFCVMAETFVDQYSAAFQKQNLKLSFDLSKNNFSVLNNVITTNAVTTTDLNITMTYMVEACQCDAVDYTCLNFPYPEIFQNEIVNICVFPALANSSIVEVSNFFMEFKVGDVVHLSPVSIGTTGPQSNELSVLTKSGDIHKVKTRLITSMFEGGNKSFEVVGNAYLQFKSNQQIKRLRDRSLQDTDAGESFFSMQVQMKKEALPAKVFPSSSSNSGVVSLFVVGGCLILVVVTLNKMKK